MVTAKMVTLEEAPDVRFGSLATIFGLWHDVRLSPDSDRKSGHAGCRLSARSGHELGAEDLFGLLVN